MSECVRVREMKKKNILQREEQGEEEGFEDDEGVVDWCFRSVGKDTAPRGGWKGSFFILGV